MGDIEDLQFSQEALLNRAYFYDGINDINLYVEDADSQFFYETIFKRLLGEKYSIKTIFPCGGKPAVIKMFKERGKTTLNIRNIYLVDGDFDSFLFPETMVKDSNFIYLKKYNIESYIINEAGLCNLVKGKLKCMDDEAYRKLNYHGWRCRIIDEAKELFLCYCIAQKFELGIPNVSRKHYDFLDQKTGFKRTDNAFENYKNQIAALLPNASSEIESIRNEFETRFGKQYDILICGKFLITSLHDYLYNILHQSIRRDDLIWCLVNTFDVNTLDFVREVCMNGNS